MPPKVNKLFQNFLCKWVFSALWRQILTTNFFLKPAVASIIKLNLIYFFALAVSISSLVITFCLFLFFRDLGTHLREEVKKVFGSGVSFTGNEQQCEENYASLKRIVDNHYFEKYPRTYKSSASGLSAEDCKAAISDDFLEYLEHEAKPTWKLWLENLRNKNVSSPASQSPINP